MYRQRLDLYQSLLYTCTLILWKMLTTVAYDSSVDLLARVSEVNLAPMASISASAYREFSVLQAVGNGMVKPEKVIYGDVHPALDGTLGGSLDHIPEAHQVIHESHQGHVLQRDCSCFFWSSASELYFTATFAGHYRVEQINVIGSTCFSGASLQGITVYIDGTPTQFHLNNVTNTVTITPETASVQTINITRPQTGNDKLIICGLKVMQAAANIANKASLKASLPLNYNGQLYSKEKSVDGLHGANADACNCCYLSQKMQSPYLEADLLQQTPVSRIVIEGRTDKNDAESSLSGVTIYLDGTEAKPEPISNGRSHIVVTPSSNVQVIRIERKQLWGKWYLMVCELQIFVHKCAPGYKGYSCNDACPNCANSCDQISGRCLEGKCKPGTYGNYCNKSCREGTFGANCIHTCHCKHDVPCNKTTGYCENGCAAGWTDPYCNKECPNGSYGYGCANACRCKYNAYCDKSTGYCSNGCDYGWTGFNCSTNLNLLPRIMDSVQTRMSSTSNDMFASLALDGYYGSTTSSSPFNCRCCSVTTGSEIPWWQLDLGNEYLIQKIFVIGHQTDSEQSSLILSSISNSSSVYDNVALSANQSTQGHLYYYKFDQPVVFQYFTVRKQNQSMMVICEVILIEGACPDHMYGHRCQHRCGSCKNNGTCEASSGVCVGGCAAGFTGKYCSGAAQADRRLPVGAIVGCSCAAVACTVIVVVLVFMFRTRRLQRSVTRQNVPDSKPDMYITPIDADGVNETTSSNGDYQEILNTYYMNQERTHPYGTIQAL